MKITEKPEWRFEHTYNGQLTVLEGAELSRLFLEFIKASEELSEPYPDPNERFVLAVFLAFKNANWLEPFTAEELTNLTTANARKVDLFLRGMVHIAKEGQKSKKQDSESTPKKTPRRKGN